MVSGPNPKPNKLFLVDLHARPGALPPGRVPSLLPGPPPLHAGSEMRRQVRLPHSPLRSAVAVFCFGPTEVWWGHLGTGEAYFII